MAACEPTVLARVAAHVVDLPLVRPFRTSLGSDSAKRALLIEVETTGGIVGWGECVADPAPTYASEFIDGALLVMRDHLLPRLQSVPNGVSAADVAEILAPVRGHEMAKGALELAVLDAECQAEGTSLARYLGGTASTVECGVSVGIPADNSIDALLAEVSAYVAEGYRRVKLKIEPGWDLAPVAAVRGRFPDLMLQVDANQGYRRSDLGLLARLDDYSLVMIEQPLEAADIVGHATLSQQLSTPVCLDESVTSVPGAEALIELGACTIVNIKAGRVGGYLAASRIHDLSLARGVPVWCGGMLETGVGRSANVALASMRGFTMPGDISTSARFFAEDLTEPMHMTPDGLMNVSDAAGAVRHPRPEMLKRFRVAHQELLR